MQIFWLFFNKKEILAKNQLGISVLPIRWTPINSYKLIISMAEIGRYAVVTKFFEGIRDLLGSFQGAEMNCVDQGNADCVLGRRRRRSWEEW